MDPDAINDLINAAPAVAKSVAAVAAAIPFTAIVKRMLGPAADEVAEMWRDQVRMYRYERQLKCVEKAERMAKDAGFTPQAVPPKILFPLLEGASFEDNEDLHTMWAALLANAASPENAIKVRPSFIAVLRQMASDEAALLNWIYGRVVNDMPDEDLHQTFDLMTLVRVFGSLGFATVSQRVAGFEKPTDAMRLMTCLNTLQAEQLIHRATEESGYALTFRGHQFVTTCRAPQKA